MSGESTVDISSEREIFIHRTINAPREMVYRAFTDPDQVQHWWGPNGFTNTIHSMDVRPGGEWRFIMHGADGTNYDNRVVYREVEAPARLAYDHFAGDEAEPHFKACVTLEETKGGTNVTLRMTFKDAAARAEVMKYGAVQGGQQTLGRLARFTARHIAARKNKLTLTLPSDREIVLTRDFDAPRALVFDAWTKPEHIRKWWGCGGMVMSVCESDLRPGGAWHYVLREKSGNEHPFKGVHSEVSPSEKVVRTQIYDVVPYNAETAIVTVVFEEHGAQTRVIESILHETVAGCQGHLQSGMEEGSVATLDRLAEELYELTNPCDTVAWTAKAD